MVHVKNIEPVKQKEKRGSKMMMVHRPKVEIKEDDLTKILSIPHQVEPAGEKPSWSWPLVAKRPKPSAVSSSSVPTSSQQVATTKPSAGFARKLALLSRKLTKVSDKLTPRHKLVKGGTKKPAEKLLWLRAKLAKVGRRNNNKQISFEVSRQPSVEDMQETPRKKGGKMRKKFSGVFSKLPAMISKLSRPSKKK